MFHVEIAIKKEATLRIPSFHHQEMDVNRRWIVTLHVLQCSPENYVSRRDHNQRCATLRNRGSIIDRRWINCHPDVPPPPPENYTRDHDQRSNTLTVEKWKVEHRYIFSSSSFLSHSPLSHFLKRLLELFRYSAIIAADIPRNHVSRRDYGVKNKGGARRGEGKEEQSGTIVCRPV